MSRSGPANAQLTIKAKFYRNGVPFNPYSISDVRIYDVATGHPAPIATLTPIQESTGIYYVTFYASDYGLSEEARTLYDEWSWVAESDMSSNTQRFTFYLTEPEEDEGSSVELETLSVVCRDLPTWTNRIGITKIDDLGNGSGIFIGWETARPGNINNNIRYNIYYSDKRLEVFDSEPKAITAEKYCTIYLNDPGNVYYFAVRATEASHSYDISKMPQLGVHLYAYPDSTELTEDLDISSHDGYDIPVSDVSGFPDTGELLIGTEILYYSSVDRANSSFRVPDDGRGYENTNIDQHRSGATVKLWSGLEDGNTVIRQGIATWFNQTPQNTDAVGEVNVDGDGYRAVNEDVVTTDLSANDDNNVDFLGYDFCGYHRPSLQETFSGDCVGSYAGGEWNGYRGFNLNERNLARLEVQLQVSGEPMLLLKRKWTGKRCRCFGLRREHQRSRCPYCYDTAFDGGFDIYRNPRPVSERFVNTEGYISVRIEPWTDDLIIKMDQGLVQEVQLNAWTLSVPQIRDRDILVRFDNEFTEEFRYEVLNVQRNRVLMNEVGRQTFIMKRLDKTDIVYAYDIDL